MINDKKQKYNEITQNIFEKSKKHKESLIKDFSSIQEKLDTFIENNDKSFSWLSKNENYFFFLEEIENIKKEFKKLEEIQKDLKDYTKNKLDEKDFRVVIYWKTNVWKSTLREALTLWDWKSIWIWSQWTTKDYHEYKWWPLQIVDVPGIWESDWNSDKWTKHAEIAFKQAQYADLLLFLISDDTSWIDYIIKYVKDHLVKLGKKIIFVINYQKYIDFDLLDELWWEEFFNLEFDQKRIEEVKNFYIKRFQEQSLYFDYDFEVINAEAWFLSVTDNKKYRKEIYNSRFLDKKEDLKIIGNLDSLEEKILDEVIKYWEQIRISWYYQFYSKQLERINNIMNSLYNSFLERRWYLEIEFNNLKNFFENWESELHSKIKEKIKKSFEYLHQDIEKMILDWLEKDDVEEYLNTYIHNSWLENKLKDILDLYQNKFVEKINNINKNFETKAIFIDKNTFWEIKLSRGISLKTFDWWSVLLKAWWSVAWAWIWWAIWSLGWPVWTWVWSAVWWLLWGIIWWFFSDNKKNLDKQKQLENSNNLKRDLNNEWDRIILNINKNISKNNEKIKKEIFSRFEKYLSIISSIISQNTNDDLNVSLEFSKEKNNFTYDLKTKKLYLKFRDLISLKRNFLDFLKRIYKDDYEKVIWFISYFLSNSILWIIDTLNSKVYNINKNLYNYLLKYYNINVIKIEENKDDINIYYLWECDITQVENYLNKFFSKNIKCYFYIYISENILLFNDKKYLYLKDINYISKNWYDLITQKNNFFIVEENKKINFILSNGMLLSTDNIDFDNNKYNILENYWIYSIIDSNKNIIDSYLIKQEENIFYSFKHNNSFIISWDKKYYYVSRLKFGKNYIAKTDKKEKSYTIINEKYNKVIDYNFDDYKILENWFLQIKKDWLYYLLNSDDFELKDSLTFKNIKKISQWYYLVEYIDNTKNILNQKLRPIVKQNFDKIKDFWNKSFLISYINSEIISWKENEKRKNITFNILNKNMKLFFENNVLYIWNDYFNWFVKIVDNNWKINFLNPDDLLYKYDFWFDNIYDFWKKYYKWEAWKSNFYILDENYDTVIGKLEYVSNKIKWWYVKIVNNYKETNFIFVANLSYKYDFWFKNIYDFWENYYKWEKSKNEIFILNNNYV